MLAANSADEILVIVALLAIAAYGFRGAVREWRGGGVRVNPPEWWWAGDRIWRAWQRAGPSASVAFLVGLIPLVVLSVFVDSYEGLALVMTLVLAGILGAGIVLMLTTSLFAWPRLMLPPELRKDRPIFWTTQAGDDNN